MKVELPGPKNQDDRCNPMILDKVAAERSQLHPEMNATLGLPTRRERPAGLQENCEKTMSSPGLLEKNYTCKYKSQQETGLFFPQL